MTRLPIWGCVVSCTVSSVGFAQEGPPSASADSADEEPEAARSWDGSLSASGSVDAGNLDQLRAQLRAHLSAHGPLVNNELDASVVVVWLRPPDGDAFAVLNRQITISERLSRKLTARWEASGFARYEPNNIRGIRHRGGVGAGVGATLHDTQNARVRWFVSGFFEGVQFRSSDFVFEPEATSPSRLGLRLASSLRLTSSSEDGRQTLRGSLLAIVNPLDTREVRVVADATANARVWGPLGFNVAATWTYDPFRLRDVKPHDVQATIGISLSRRGTSSTGPQGS